MLTNYVLLGLIAVVLGVVTLGSEWLTRQFEDPLKPVWAWYRTTHRWVGWGEIIFGVACVAYSVLDYILNSHIIPYVTSFEWPQLTVSTALALLMILKFLEKRYGRTTRQRYR